MNKRKSLLIAVGAVAVLVVAVGAGLAIHAAHSPKTPPDDPVQDQKLASAAIGQVQARKAEVLGMTLPLNAQPYAPIYPDGFIVDESQSPTSPNAGKVQYDAAAPVGAVVEFYKAAAQRAGLQAQVTTVSPDVTEVKASDGHRSLTARMTRQFATSTVVDLDYS
jgi:hypothetical protein